MEKIPAKLAFFLACLLLTMFAPTAQAACEIDEYGNEVNCAEGGSSGSGDGCLQGQILGKPCGYDRTIPCMTYSCSILGIFGCGWSIEWKAYCAELDGYSQVCVYGNTSVNC